MRRPGPPRHLQHLSDPQERPEVILRLRPDVHLAPTDGGQVDVVRSGTGVARLRAPARGVREALDLLAGDGAPEDALADVVAAADGAAALTGWYYLVERLTAQAALRTTLVSGGCAVLHAEVIAPGGRVGSARAGASPLVLSRFAAVRRVGAELVADSPRSRVRVTLVAGETVRLLHALAGPRSAGELAAVVPEWPRATLESALGLLLDAGCVVPLGEDGSPEEDAASRGRLWEPEDLRFHAHSRMGHHDRPMGGAYPFRGEVTPSPALRPPGGTRVTELPLPDAAALEASDPTLFHAMESRRSGRPPFTRPVRLDELSTLLWRTARVDTGRAWGNAEYEILSRPHPSGGATYPLEWYVVHGSRDGLGAGIHRYMPDRHALEEVPAAAGAAEEILARYHIASSEGAGVPPLVLVLTARFARVSWKYRSVAYALILKEVGVVMQSVYLVASAMGLEACALGAGDDVLFGRLTGLDPLEEASVGELMLGAHFPARDAQPAS